MNRSIIVSLLKKNIDELILLTEGFSEMTHYPEAILHLAKNKTSDIRTYIDMLGEVEKAPVVPEIIIAEPIPEEIIEVIAEEPAIMEEIIEEVISEPEIIEEIQEELPVEIIEEVVEDDKVEIEEISLIELDEEEENIEEEELEDEKDEEENEDDDEANAEIVVEEDEEEEVETDEDDTEEEDDDDHIVIEEVEEPEIIEIPKVTTIGDKLTSNGISRNDLHARPEMTGIHASIANKKVEDVRQAISLGDRFRFQRELFKNNGEEMNKMLSYINQLATYDEVVSFLKSKYAWPDDNEAANDFYQLVKRKF
jgi:hypothetical protein